jgi:hypothetical protein
MVEKGSKEHMAWQIQERQEKRRQEQFSNEKPTMYSRDMQIDDERREWEARAAAGIEGGAGLGYQEGGDSGGGASSTGIKSQWEKTLKGSARNDLQQINDQTGAARTAHEDKRQAKERRRQMLREKQQQRLSKQKAMRGEVATAAVDGTDAAGGATATTSSVPALSVGSVAAADATAFLRQVL